MPKALIIEDSRSHSETLGFFIQSCQRAGFDCVVYLGTEALSDTYLGDLAQIFNFKTFNERSLLRPIIETLTSDDLVIVNSARNFKLRHSAGAELLSIAKRIGFPLRRIIVQCHNGPDIDLPALVENPMTMIAATPIFNRNVAAKFLPIFDAIGDRGHPRCKSLTTAIFTIGGMAPHARGDRELSFIPKVADRPNTTVHICCRTSHVADLDFATMGYDLQSMVLNDWSGLSIAHFSARFQSFIAINLKPNSIYHTRLLTGAIPFAINYGLPVLADASIAEKYILPDNIGADFNGPAIINYLDLRADYDQLWDRWQDFRKDRILYEQSLFHGFLQSL